MAFSRDPEGCRPWYGSPMLSKRLPESNDPPKPRRAHSPAGASRLFRYRPVPPAGCDEDGYPFEDGKPMSESDHQLHPLVYAFTVLRSWYRGRPDVYVASDLFLNYDKGDRSAAVVPDLFVVVGAEDRKRRSYKLWQEPKAPDLVLEVLSHKTWRVDLGIKRDTYEALGVAEYWLFDPLDRYMDEPLRGYRLRKGVYRRLSADASGRWFSEVLGLELYGGAGELRFRDPAAGEDLMAHREAVGAYLAAKSAHQAEKTAHRATRARLEQEVAARRTAERRTAEAEARIAALEAALRESGKTPQR